MDRSTEMRSYQARPIPGRASVRKDALGRLLAWACGFAGTSNQETSGG